MRRVALVSASGGSTASLAVACCTHFEYSARSGSGGLLCQVRRRGLYGFVHSFTESKLANSYKPGTQTSKGLSEGPQHGVGFDPVYSHHRMTLLTGPLRRKVSSTPQDYLNVDEAERWMDAQQAAKVLGIKENELVTLNRYTLEERWVKVYHERHNAHKEEVLIAAEILLEYIDSTLQHKKSRAYYRNAIQNTREGIDMELALQHQSRNAKYIWMSGVAVLGACTVVLYVAYMRQKLSKEDFTDFGTQVMDYMTMSFLQPTNLEPAPDYATRYFYTPSSLEVDQKAGRSGTTVFMDSQAGRLLEEKEAYHRKEDAEMLKMLNDENERAVAQQRDAAARDSRVKVYRPEDFDENGHLKPPVQPGAPAKVSLFHKPSFSEFNEMINRNFGGGSHFRRMTKSTTERAAEHRAAQQRQQESQSPSTAPEETSTEQRV